MVAFMSQLAHAFGAPRGLAQLLTAQHAVATREQLSLAGVSRALLEANLAARRWRRLNDHVVVTHNGPLTRRQQLWAVVLSAASPALLCSVTVYELFDIPTDGARAIHVLVPRGAKVLPIPGVDVKVHESRRFPGPQEYRWREGIPMTSLARAAVDAAAWSSDIGAALRTLVAPLQARRLRPEQISQQLDLAGRVRYRRELRALLDDMTGGAQALSEVEFLRFCRRHGFPKPRCQARLDSLGKRRYLDAEFRCRSGRLLRVEIDGGIHLKLEIRARDTIKDNDAHLAGELVLRYASYSIYTDDPVVVRQLKVALDG